MLNRAIIRSEVAETKFGIFTDDAKKELSVVSIQTAETLDMERKPIEGYMIFHSKTSIIYLLMHFIIFFTVVYMILLWDLWIRLPFAKPAI